jgi:hypothetical protein
LIFQISVYRQLGDKSRLQGVFRSGFASLGGLKTAQQVFYDGFGFGSRPLGLNLRVSGFRWVTAHLCFC